MYIDVSKSIWKANNLGKIKSASGRLETRLSEGPIRDALSILSPRAFPAIDSSSSQIALNGRSIRSSRRLSNESIATQSNAVSVQTASTNGKSSLRQTLGAQKSPMHKSSTSTPSSGKKRKLRNFEDRTYQPNDSHWRESMRHLIAPGINFVEQARLRQQDLKANQGRNTFSSPDTEHTPDSNSNGEPGVVQGDMNITPTSDKTPAQTLQSNKNGVLITPKSMLTSQPENGRKQSLILGGKKKSQLLTPDKTPLGIASPYPDVHVVVPYAIAGLEKPRGNKITTQHSRTPSNANLDNHIGPTPQATVIFGPITPITTRPLDCSITSRLPHTPVRIEPGALPTPPATKSQTPANSGPLVEMYIESGETDWIAYPGGSDSESNDGASNTGEGLGGIAQSLYSTSDEPLTPKFIRHKSSSEYDDFPTLTPHIWGHPNKRRRPAFNDDSALESPLVKKVRRHSPFIAAGSAAGVARRRRNRDVALFDNDYFTVRLIPNEDDAMTGVEIEQKPDRQQRSKAGKARMMMIRCLAEGGEMDVNIRHVSSMV